MLISAGGAVALGHGCHGRQARQHEGEVADPVHLNAVAHAEAEDHQEEQRAIPCRTPGAWSTGGGRCEAPGRAHRAPRSSRSRGHLPTRACEEQVLQIGAPQGGAVSGRRRKARAVSREGKKRVRVPLRAGDVDRMLAQFVDHVAGAPFLDQPPVVAGCRLGGRGTPPPRCSGSSAAPSPRPGGPSGPGPTGADGSGGSRPTVGSSRSRRDGWWSRARRIVTRRLMPPGKGPGQAPGPVFQVGEGEQFLVRGAAAALGACRGGCRGAPGSPAR